VWRQPTDYFYDLKWTDRMGREMFHPGIKSPLARLLKTLHPMAVGNSKPLTAMSDQTRIPANIPHFSEPSAKNQQFPAQSTPSSGFFGPLL
jgi:hypothetical protein